MGCHLTIVDLTHGNTVNPKTISQSLNDLQRLSSIVNFAKGMRWGVSDLHWEREGGKICTAKYLIFISDTNDYFILSLSYQ